MLSNLHHYIPPLLRMLSPNVLYSSKLEIVTVTVTAVTVTVTVVEIVIKADI